MNDIEPDRPASPPARSDGPPSLGAWLGPQVGCTCWMLTGMVEFGSGSPRVALVWAACFVVANGLGWWLWRLQKRGRLRYLRAVQWLVLICLLLGLIAILASPGGPTMTEYRPVLIGGLIMVGAFEFGNRLRLNRGVG